MPISCLWQLLSHTTALCEYESVHTNLISKTLAWDWVSVLRGIRQRARRITRKVNYRRIKFGGTMALSPWGQGNSVQEPLADVNQSPQQSPRRCGSSGGALISLIGRLGVEHIIEFDLPHHPDAPLRPTPPTHTCTHASNTIHQSIGHCWTSEFSGAFNCLTLHQSPTSRCLASTFRHDLKVNIDSKTGKHLSHVFWSCSARKITCLSTQELKKQKKKRVTVTRGSGDD